MTSPVNHNYQLTKASVGAFTLAAMLPEKTPLGVRLGAGIVSGGILYAAGEPGNEKLRLVVSTAAGIFATIRGLPNNISSETRLAAGAAATLVIYNTLSPGNDEAGKPRSFWRSGYWNNHRPPTVTRERVGDNHMNTGNYPPLPTTVQPRRERVGSK